MVISNSFSYAFGPIVALVGIGAMVLVLRWAYSRGSSVVAAPGKSGPSDSYGLLVCVANLTLGRSEHSGQRTKLFKASLGIYQSLLGI